MNASSWEFADEVASRSPAPAGVAAAAVAADLGLSLLIKALLITGNRPDVLASARAESVRLRAFAAEDIAAVRDLMRSRDAAAMRRAIEVPMRAARSAAAGLALCVEARGAVSGLLAADLGAAAALLCGAVRAILVCVEANLRTQGSSEITAERKALESDAVRQAESILGKI